MERGVRRRNVRFCNFRGEEMITVIRLFYLERSEVISLLFWTHSSTALHDFLCRPTLSTPSLMGGTCTSYTRNSGISRFHIATPHLHHLQFPNHLPYAHLILSTALICLPTPKLTSSTSPTSSKNALLCAPGIALLALSLKT